MYVSGIPSSKVKEVCEKCERPMVIKTGRFGRFIACTGFPDCKNAKPIVESTGVSCPECEDGDLIVKKATGFFI